MVWLNTLWGCSIGALMCVDFHCRYDGHLGIHTLHWYSQLSLDEHLYPLWQTPNIRCNMCNTICMLQPFDFIMYWSTGRALPYPISSLVSTSISRTNQSMQSVCEEHMSKDSWFQRTRQIFLPKTMCSPQIEHMFVVVFLTSHVDLMDLCMFTLGTIFYKKIVPAVISFRRSQQIT